MGSSKKPCKYSLGTEIQNQFLFRKGEPFPGCAFFINLDDAISYTDSSILIADREELAEEPADTETDLSDEAILKEFGFTEDSDYEPRPYSATIADQDTIYGLALPKQRFDEFFNRNGIGWVVREAYKGRGIEMQARLLGTTDEIRDVIAKQGLARIIASLR